MSERASVMIEQSGRASAPIVGDTERHYCTHFVRVRKNRPISRLPLRDVAKWKSISHILTYMHMCMYMFLFCSVLEFGDRTGPDTPRM